MVQALAALTRVPRAGRSRRRVLADDGAQLPEVVAEAKSLADDLEQLGPTFVKLGQLLSTRPDF